MRRLVLSIALLATVCTALSSVWPFDIGVLWAQTGNAQLDELQRRLDNTIRERGTLESASVVNVTSPISSTLLELAPEGQSVQEGDLIARLDSSELRIRLEQEQVAMAQIESRIDAAELAYSSAKEQLELAEQVISQRRKLLDMKRVQLKGQIPQDSDSTEHRIAWTELELAELEARLSSARLLTELQHNLRQAFGQREAAEAERSLKRDELLRLERSIASCSIRAPRSGVLVYPQTTTRRTADSVLEEGSVVRERQTIATVVDQQQLQLRVRVHETRVARLRPRQPARVTFDALPNRVFEGAVTSVSRTATPASWPNTDLREYDAIVRLTAGAPDLKLGLTALVEVDVSATGR